MVRSSNIRGRVGRRAPVLAAAVLAATITCSAAGQDEPPAPPAPAAQPAPIDDPRIDAATGRVRGHFPPPRHFDHLHMRLEIDIPSMDEPRFDAVQTLRVTPIGSPRDTLVLNSSGIGVASVESAGVPLKYVHEEDTLTIILPRPIKIGETVEVVTRYSQSYPPNRGEALTWTPGDPDAESLTNRAPQIHSQGQPESNHLWFPCHDFPNERLTTEMLVTVEEGFAVCSNGRLVGTRLTPDGRTQWHWLQDKPHVNYLALLVVGKFAIIGVPSPASAAVAGATSVGIALPLYTPFGTEENAAEVYKNTGRIIENLERVSGEPYPWDKYAQLLVRNFRAGGMENTSATTLQSRSATARPGSQDSVISHEAAHQWFGDLMTCKSWEHAWLNEGWASFGEALWAERAGRDSGGEKRAKERYQRTIAGFMARQRNNRTTAPNSAPMASRRYNAPFENFVKRNDIYSKGACVLHMLRVRLGDEAFFRGVRLYVQRNKLRTVETDDFRYALEEASGVSLERFFDQWVRRPGVPRVELDVSWDEPSRQLSLVARQTQLIDQLNPAYTIDIPVVIRPNAADSGASGTGAGQLPWTHSLILRMDGSSAEATVSLPFQPGDVVIDPDATVLMWSRVNKPGAMWLRQLADPPTEFARLEAGGRIAETVFAAAARAASEVRGWPGRRVDRLAASP